MPLFHPGTDVGQVQREVHEIERKVNDKAENWRLDQVSNKVDNLEHTIREVSTRLDGMESRLQELEANQIKQED
jgi:hypothetical protein